MMANLASLKCDQQRGRKVSPSTKDLKSLQPANTKTDCTKQPKKLRKNTGVGTPKPPWYGAHNFEISIQLENGMTRANGVVFDEFDF